MDNEYKFYKNEKKMIVRKILLMRFSIEVGDNKEDIKKKERLFLKNVVSKEDSEPNKLIKQFVKEIKKYYRLKIKTPNKS